MFAEIGLNPETVGGGALLFGLPPLMIAYFRRSAQVDERRDEASDIAMAASRTETEKAEQRAVDARRWAEEERSRADRERQRADELDRRVWELERALRDEVARHSQQRDEDHRAWERERAAYRARIKALEGPDEK